MMVLDTRGMTYTDSFRSISSLLYSDYRDDLEIVVLAETQEKVYVIKEFAERLLGLSVSLEEESNTLFVRTENCGEIVPQPYL